MNYSENQRVLRGDYLSRIFKNGIEYSFFDNSKNEYVFSNLIIEGDFNIIGLADTSMDCLFENCIFHGNIIFDIETCGYSFSFWNIKVKGSIRIGRGKYERNLSFNYVEFEDFDIWGGQFLASFEIIGCRGSIYISEGDFKHLKIFGKRKLRIRTDDELIEVQPPKDFPSPEIFNLDITVTTLKGSILITKVNIHQVTIDGTLQQWSSIEFIQVRVFHFCIGGFDNQGKFAIDEMTAFNPLVFKSQNIEDSQEFSPAQTARGKSWYMKTSFFEVGYSNLGFATFSLIDFRSFQEINFFKSKLTNVEFSHVKFPLSIKSVFPIFSNSFFARFDGRIKTNRSQWLSIRENYRQMKFACAKQQDGIGEQYFRALEMKAHDYSLRWIEQFWTKLILKLSYWTSNFGQSFIRPIICLLLINGILYHLLLNAQHRHLTLQNISGADFVDIVADFIRVNNPLHKNEIEFTGSAFIYDTMIRVFSSYFLYNIIRATRRFVG